MTFPESSQVPADPTPLGYAPALAIRRRRRVQQRAIAAVILVVLLTAPCWARPIWLHVKSAYWRTQCVSHPVPAGIVVFQSDSPAISIVSPQWTTLHAIPLGASWQWSTAKLDGTAYSGVRTASNGQKRLVVINAAVGWQSNKYAYVEITADTYPIGVFASGSDHTVCDIGGENWSNGSSLTVPTPEITVFSAVEDPQDASHLTVNFNVFWDQYVIDCWLTPNGLRASQARSRRSRSAIHPTTTASELPSAN
jgi:hypothetical protein